MGWRWATRGNKDGFNTLPDSYLKEQLGDYDFFKTTDCRFCCTGNIFTDTGTFSPEADIIPGQQNGILAPPFDWIEIIDNHGLALPKTHTLNSLLVPLSTRLPNTYILSQESSGLFLADRTLRTLP